MRPKRKEVPRPVLACVYCDTTVAHAADGDHVVPASLGKFRGKLLFKNICAKCNNELSRGEEQLVRCSPEGLILRELRPPLERAQRGRSLVGADGAPPPRRHIVHDDHDELVLASSTSPSNVEAPDQLVVRCDDGTQQNIRLFPSMTTEALRSKLASLRLSPKGTVHLRCNDETWDIYVALLRSVWPKCFIEEQASREPGTHRVKVSVRCQVSSAFFRAIAKIGFHYYLLHSQRGYTGREPFFRAIRTFIRHGGKVEEFFGIQGESHRLQLPSARRGDKILSPARWQHFLICDEVEGIAVAVVYLFVGPGRLPTPYHITLATLPSELVAPFGYRAHAYVYASVPHEDDGEVVPLALVRQ